nr:hypothetical protein [Tanacetum cinerariifolium]
MFDTDVLNDEEVVVKDVNAASIATAVTTAATTDVSIDDITLAQALVEIKTSKPKARGIIMQEPSKTPTTTTIPISSKVLDKGKGIMVEEPLKMKKKYQISFDEQEARRLQAKIDEQDRLAEEKENAQLIEDENLAWDNVFSNMRRVGKDFSGSDTPLFLTMLVPAQEEELGEGLTMPSAPQHTQTIIQPSTSKPQKKQNPRKPRRQDTQETQYSDLTDEA